MSNETQLKSLAEIAFDAYQAFAEHTKRYHSWNILTKEERNVFERIANRVECEALLRRVEF